MTSRTLGNSDLRISPIGVGTWAIGGDGTFGWGPQDDADSIAAIRRAVELGIDWVDTAPIYGMGHAEDVVAKALEPLGADRPLVFTKCSLIWDEDRQSRHSLDPRELRLDVEGSLRRLRSERLDLCQIHWPAFPPGRPASGIEEAWTELAAMVQEGKIRHIGVSNFDAAQLALIQPIHPVTSLQPPYSMLMRQIEAEVLPYCEAHGIGVIGYSPMHNGLLSGAMTRSRIAAMPRNDWRRRANPAFQEPVLTEALDLVERMRAIGERHGRSAGEVAIAWTLRLPAVTGAIVGARNPAQVDGFIGAMDFRLSEAELAELGELPDSVDMMKLG